jgi:hypothetical protein
MITRLQYLVALNLVLTPFLWSGRALAAPSPAPIVKFFTDDFYLNLHHFLYVLGRAEAKLPDSKRDGVRDAPADQERGLAALGDNERKTWRAAVSAYAVGLSKSDVVSSRDLVTLAGALAVLPDPSNLESASSAVAPDVAATLNRAAPIFRTVWWPAQHRANRQWADAMRPIVDRHGPAILAFIMKIYGLPWPAGGYPVHISGYTNWAGAYSTSGPLLMIASLDKGTAGMDGLELIFHESMHQWDEPLLARLQQIGAAIGKKVPPLLTHALIWMTAGEATRRVLPDYTPIAERGIWERADYPKLKPALDATWLPYLRGAGTRDEALLELMKAVGK